MDYFFYFGYFGCIDIVTAYSAPGLSGKHPREKVPGSIPDAARPFSTSCLILMVRMVRIRMIIIIRMTMKIKIRKIKMTKRLGRMRIIKEKDDKDI